MCILRQNKGTDISKDQSMQVSFSWNSSDLHFSLGLGLSLVCETGDSVLNFTFYINIQQKVSVFIKTLFLRGSENLDENCFK